MQDGYHKIYACCQYAHATVEASLALHARLDAKHPADALEEILVETHPRAMALTTVEPETVLAAKFSIPHAAAAVATLGSGGARAFSAATMADQTIDALRRRVRLQPFTPLGEPPHDRPSRVTWRFHDGAEWTETCLSAQGGPDRPFGEQTLVAKCIENAGAAFPAMQPALAEIVAGAPAALARAWSETVQAMIAGSHTHE
jgi:2-methylcitrate dehydratase PrpD